MSRFTAELTITQLSGEVGAWRRWRLHEALYYEVGEENSGRMIIVPLGFVSDGPSIPQVFWNLMPVWGTWGRAGIVHDYLCARIAIGHPHKEARTRDQADKIFYEAMKVLGVCLGTRLMLYLGVRIGTWLNVPLNMIRYNKELIEKDIEP